MRLLLHRTQGRAGDCEDDDFDVFDGNQNVGRIYLVDGFGGSQTWFWGVAFMVTRRKSYGYADSLDEAEAAFKAEYER